jgi:heme-degrading monooxygenase HmoA
MIVWEFFVQPEHAKSFESAYGAKGDWARLFGRGSGYLGTFLLKDDGISTRYMTVDRWFSKQHYDRFRLEHAEEYHRLDSQFQSLTTTENQIGMFSSCD